MIHILAVWKISGGVKVVGSVLVLMTCGWLVWFVHATVIGSRRKAWAHVTELRRGGFSVDYILKGNIYVLFDHTQRKIAFVFSDKSFVYDYGDVTSVTRYWLNFPGIKLKNTMVFGLQGKKIRCGSLSTRQAEYWHHRSVELIGA
jgi:hypothetical protein